MHRHACMHLLVMCNFVNNLRLVIILFNHNISNTLECNTVKFFLMQPPVYSRCPGSVYYNLRGTINDSQRQRRDVSPAININITSLSTSTNVQLPYRSAIVINISSVNRDMLESVGQSLSFTVPPPATTVAPDATVTPKTTSK